MKCIKRTLSAMLAIVILTLSCSCSGKATARVTELADLLGECITDRDYEEMESLFTQGDGDIEDLLTLVSSSSDDEKDIEARELIADTISYEVDEDSFTSDTWGREGSVDITFEYVSYEDAVEGHIFEDIEDFASALDDCSKKEEVTVTFTFVKEGKEYLFTNIEDVKQIFPYVDETFSWIQPREDYVTDVSFYGSTYDAAANTYCDASELRCEVALDPDSLCLDWDFYYKITADDSLVFWSNGIDFEYYGSDRAVATYSEISAGYVEPGHYVFTFYTMDDELFAEASCDVTVTETAAADPVPAPSSSSSASLAYFDEDPSDGISFDGTDLVLDLPSGMVTASADELEESLPERYDDYDDTVFYASDDAIMCSSYAYFYRAESYDSEWSVYYVENSIRNDMDGLGYAGYEAESYTSEWTVGGHTYTVYTIKAVGFDYILYYNYVMIGDEDSAYFLAVFYLEENHIDDVMNGLHTV